MVEVYEPYELETIRIKKLVDFDDYVALKAENERLTKDVDFYKQQFNDQVESREDLERALAERAGGVKVEVLQFHLAQLRHAYTHLKAGTVVDQSGFADGLISPAIAAIEAALTTEPAAPEGRQEAVTEAQVEAAAREIATAHRLHGRNFTAMARAALKAAMEAGR